MSGFEIWVIFYMLIITTTDKQECIIKLGGKFLRAVKKSLIDLTIPMTATASTATLYILQAGHDANYCGSKFQSV